MYSNIINLSKKNCLNHVNKQIFTNGLNRHISTSHVKFENKEKESNLKSKETDSFLINMFKGNLKLDCVFPYPDVLNEDQKETLNMYIPQATKLYKEINDPLLNDKNASLDPKVEKIMKEMGAFGVMTPAEYGGAEMNATQFARLGEVIGSNDLGISVHLGAHQSIGYKGIVLFGNEEQKKKYLPSLAAGEKLAAFCLTEPSSGSDASSIRTNAKLSSDGKHYILNGSKIWISNGGIASVFTVFAKTLVKNDKGQEKEKVTAFIVEKDFGVKSGPAEQKMGIKCSNTTEIYFENTKVPVENVLGEVGNGFKVAMNILNSGRFGMVAALTGSMKNLIEKATEHANNRVQFGSKLSTFGTIQEKIARMAMSHYTCESLAYMIAGMMDKGAKDFQLEAAVGKITASESAWNVCDETIQILGGMGYMREAGVEKVLRDLRIFRIFEGTNDILRLFIALTGLQYTGSHLKDLQKALKNPVANLGYIFDQGTRRVIRSVGLTSGPSLSDFVAPELKSTASNVTKCMQNFTQASEKLLIKYNKDIVHEQFLLNRIANSAIDIYIMTVLLSRATNSIQKNYKTTQHEINIVKAICSEKCEQVEFNLMATKSSEKLKLYDRLKQISNEITNKSGVAHIHPIDEE